MVWGTVKELYVGYEKVIHGSNSVIQYQHIRFYSNVTLFFECLGSGSYNKLCIFVALNIYLTYTTN